MEILASLQKPKKISLKASDGKCYTMMCKPKDDLRKDCRLMEFNCLINKVINNTTVSSWIRKDFFIKCFSISQLVKELWSLDQIKKQTHPSFILMALFKEINNNEETNHSV